MRETRPLRLTAISTEDIDAIAALERRCFQIPWSPASLAAELSIAGAGGFAAVDRDDEALAGYIFYRIMIDEMHILKVATDPARRNRGIASRLLEKAAGLARQRRVRQICLEVRASNIPAINLYGRHGFALTGRRPGYYDHREDAILMSKKINIQRRVVHGSTAPAHRGKLENV